MDLSKLSDKDLENIEKGNFAGLSDAALDVIDPPKRPKSNVENGLDYLLSSAGVKLNPILAAANLGKNVARNVAANPTSPVLATKAAIDADESVLGTALDAVSSVGRFAHTGNQQLAEALGSLGRPGKVAGKAWEFTSDTLMPQDRMGALLLPLAAPKVEASVNAGRKLAGEAATKTGAQILRAGPGLAEDYGKQFLKDPVRVLTASSLEQAGQRIAAAAEKSGLKVGREGFKEVFKSGTAPDPKGMVKLADDALVGRDVTAALTPQEAIAHLQAINHVELMPKYQNPLNKSEMAYLLEYKSKLSQLLRDWGHGEVLDALGAYRHSVIRDKLMSLLPTNLNSSVSKLGTGVMAGLGIGSEAHSRYSGSGSSPMRDIAAMATFSPIIAGPAMGGASLLAQGLGRAMTIPAKLLALKAIEQATGANRPGARGF